MEQRHAEYIAKAKAEGGHLSWGQGNGLTVYWRNGNVSGFGETTAEQMMALAQAEGLPTVDMRPADFAKLCKVVISGPMVSCNPDDLSPEHHNITGFTADGPFGYVSFAQKAAAYREAGCVVTGA